MVTGSAETSYSTFHKMKFHKTVKRRMSDVEDSLNNNGHVKGGQYYTILKHITLRKNINLLQKVQSNKLINKYIKLLMDYHLLHRRSYID